MTATLRALQQHLWQGGTRTDVYAVVDGARDRRIFSNLVNSYANSVCLYRGDLHPELEFAAPYLVQVDFHDRFTQSLIRDGWGNSWGIFMKSPDGMDRLRRHLRTLLRVQDEAARKLVFRYYDPRVLRTYLPTCFAEELKTVFGSIECFYTEAEDPAQLLEFRFDRGKLVKNLVSLPEVARESAADAG